MNGWDEPIIDFWFGRLNTSFVPCPVACSLAHVKAAVKSSPWEYCFVAFICSESYQLFPSGAHIGVRPLLNCG